MAAPVPEPILEAIHQRDRFLVTAHSRPDGDAVGSLLACGMLLNQLGKHADLVLADRVPLIYRTLPGAECIRQSEVISPQKSSGYDAVILLECDGILRSRLKGIEDQYLINIDHHQSGRNFAQLNWIDTSACALAEMIFELAQATAVTITPAMATCLYTAVITDTGSFSYPGTDAHTFALAEQLVQHGASPVEIAQDVYFSNPTSKMHLLGAALSNLHREGRLTWMWVTNDDMERIGAAEEDCEGLVNYAIGISGVDVAVFLRELPDHRVRLSIRSKGAVDVAAIAERFGGGGHESASGCTLDERLSLAMDRILSELRQTLTPASLAASRRNGGPR